jgi:hypothetical protein
LTIMAIDFEASCLPRHGRSFPIEVGIAGGGIARSWIIRPHAAWAGWDWTAEAEALHGLSRARIEAEGEPADVVLAQLAAAVAGCRVVADSVIDQYWLQTLADTEAVVAPFAIDHVSLLLDEWGADEPRIAAAMAHADALHTARHRAVADALWLSGLIEALSGAARPLQASPVIARVA